jgi:hypothetical protein
VVIALADYGTLSRRQGQPAYPAFGLKPFGQQKQFAGRLTAGLLQKKGGVFRDRPDQSPALGERRLARLRLARTLPLAINRW